MAKVKQKKKCIEIGCIKDNACKGYCKQHYVKRRRHGEFGNRIKCSILDCELKTMTKGYCHKHYQIFRKHGDATHVIYQKRSKTPKKCSIENCERIHLAKGFCGYHYEKFRIYWYVKPTSMRKNGFQWPKFSNKDKICQVEKCEEEARCKGYCKKHYRRFVVHGDPNIVKMGGTKRKNKAGKKGRNVRYHTNFDVYVTRFEKNKKEANELVKDKLTKRMDNA